MLLAFVAVGAWLIMRSRRPVVVVPETTGAARDRAINAGSMIH
jgi:hypothetical protein